jgi:hypothetical protein
VYLWIVFLHVAMIFIFLIQHAAEIWVSFKLREQKEPEGIFATYAFMPNNNVRNLRITYLLIILTGMTAGFLTTLWRQGWMWTALGVMIIIWIVMRRVSDIYLYAVDAIAEAALRNREDPSTAAKFISDLKARREPEILSAVSGIGGLIILWLMMFKPF